MQWCIAHKQDGLVQSVGYLLQIFHSLHLSPVCRCILSDCTLGTLPPDPVASNPHIESGQFFDFSHPVTCGGNITTWHFCYYTSTVASDRRYSLWFRVWRQISGNNFNLVGETAVRREAPTDITSVVICEDAMLDVDAYISVMEGDILAVYVPFTLSTVSIIGSGVSGSSLHADNRNLLSVFQGTTVNRQDNTDRMSGLALYLYSDIEVGKY